MIMIKRLIYAMAVLVLFVFRGILLFVEGVWEAAVFIAKGDGCDFSMIADALRNILKGKFD